MSKKQITVDDILKVIRDLCAKGDTGTTYTKDIVLECDERFPDVHVMSVLTIMGSMKKDGLLKYVPANMEWWLTADGKRRLEEKGSGNG